MWFLCLVWVLGVWCLCLLRKLGWFACVCGGIRDLPTCFKRRPCAGRHLLFFAAAKKSRQKKAAHTASSSICLRAPTGSYASHGDALVRGRCQRSLCTHHPLHIPASRHAVPESPLLPRWQTVCRPSRYTRTTPDWVARLVSLVRTPTCTVRQPTHRLPPGRHKPFAAAGLGAGIRSG
jgi:hypothetical protein